MRLVQFIHSDGSRKVAVPSADGMLLQVVSGATQTHQLALQAAREHRPLAELVQVLLGMEFVAYDEVIAQKRLLIPIDHPDPAHMILSGTGLNHLGSAMARNAMHAQTDAAQKSDSLRMFELGLQGGKPAPGSVGAQPEWFYKGDGRWVVAPEQALVSPPFALDGGEEGELTGVYVNGDNGDVLRVGFCLGNEFSDHVTERQNYLLLAHSKLRPCSFGPELWIGDIPADIRGVARVVRNGIVVWQEGIATGEANMTNTIANMEHHHFKYAPFRAAGDVHVHFFGASALSVSAGVQTQGGDVFEIECPLFGKPLRNPLVISGAANVPVVVRGL